MSSSEPHDRTPPEEQPPLQFSLRTLMLGVTASAVVCGMLVSLPGMWGWTLLFFALLVVAHVVGNRLGTSLREQADEQISSARSDRAKSALAGLTEKAAARLASAEPTGSWQKKSPLNRGYLIFAAVCGVFGAVFGGIAISTSIGPNATVAGICVASAASGVLGGFVGFLVSTLLSTFAGGVIEAQRHSQPDKKR